MFLNVMLLKGSFLAINKAAQLSKYLLMHQES